jgi:hypothetical protein
MTVNRLRHARPTRRRHRRTNDLPALEAATPLRAMVVPNMLGVLAHAADTGGSEVKIPAGTYQTRIIKRRPQVQLEVVQGAYDGCRITVGMVELPPHVVEIPMYSTPVPIEVQFRAFMPPREEL